MASKSSVWGIEIGQSAIKALRCRIDGDTVVAEAFDYIEYPKILSQPEAEPEVLVREALETFVSRNDLKKCRVALSVPGQSGLAKFFKPPPVELKKIPDIVKYEAKQQIPFDLKDVIWDYQLMSGGDVSMLVLEQRAEFLKKASSTITFTCEDGPKVFETVKAAVSTRQPQTITMLGTGRNANGETVARVFITWTFKLRA